MIKKEKGFTLIELVIVILLIAIMAAVVNALLGDTTSTKAYGTARKIQSDIIFAQEQAMTHRIHFRVRFTSSSGYTVEQCTFWGASSCSVWGSVIDPSTNTSPFAVTLNSGNYAGVTLDFPTGFGGNYVEFNSAGTPLDGSTYAGCSTAPCPLISMKSVSLYSVTRSVSVSPGTGKTAVY